MVKTLFILTKYDLNKIQQMAEHIKKDSQKNNSVNENIIDKIIEELSKIS